MDNRLVYSGAIGRTENPYHYSGNVVEHWKCATCGNWSMLGTEHCDYCGAKKE